jgi:hypothetical protein
VKPAVHCLAAKQPVRATFSTEASGKAAGRFSNARAESTDEGSGMGQKVEKVTVQTLTLH